MIVIFDPSEVIKIPDPDIRTLAYQRLNEVGNMNAIVVQPGDSVSTLEQESGCPIMSDLFGESRYGDDDFSPSFEVLEEHECCYEMGFILSDDGFAVVFFIPKLQGIDASLLAMCAEYAEPVGISPDQLTLPI